MKSHHSQVNGWNWRKSFWARLVRFRRSKIVCSPSYADFFFFFHWRLLIIAIKRLWLYISFLNIELQLFILCRWWDGPNSCHQESTFGWHFYKVAIICSPARVSGNSLGDFQSCISFPTDSTVHRELVLWCHTSQHHKLPLPVQSCRDRWLKEGCLHFNDNASIRTVT
jgi:hypothetical protein